MVNHQLCGRNMLTPKIIYKLESDLKAEIVRLAPYVRNVQKIRSQCTKAKVQGRSLGFLPQVEYEALKRAREAHASVEGQERYKRRAGIEGTISQGVRGFGLRRSRYRGLAKTHLQNLAIAAAINIDRLFNWFCCVPRAKTRISRFTALADS